MRLDFGKYRGQLISEVPVSYLEWALENCAYLKTPVRKALQDELMMREEEDEVQSADRFMEERC